MRKHKLVSLFAAVCLLGVFTLGGCGKKSTTEVTTTVTQTTAATPTPTAVPGSDLTSLEVVKLMGNGTNLGNTMEAYGHASLGISADTSAYETLWGQPVTSQAIIDGLHDSGFDTLRIPVAWTNMMDFENGDFTINQAYIDRVKEIIDYAYNDGMYVIVNDHWDGGWWGMFGSASEETVQKAWDLYKSMWTQLATAYKDYDYHLVFEGGNEEIGERLNDITDYSADGNTLTEDECYSTAAKINQTFVDTVRATGGNNADRFLLIPGYGTNIANTLDERYVFPTDTAKDKLILSVHDYDPWSYCGGTGDSKWGNQKHYKDIDDTLASLTAFTDKGIGVIIGEYGVLPQSDGSLKSNTIAYLTNFLDNCDYYGYCPVLWDCSGYYIRKDLAWVDSDLEAFYKDRSLSSQIAKYGSDGTYTDDVDAKVKEAAKADMDANLAAAPESLSGSNAASGDTATAWIMYNSNDYGISYSVGDTYDPDSTTEGLVATDTQITGEGTYTVALDFTGTANGYANSVAFSAVGISNAETLFPGYIIDIKEVDINGSPYTLLADPYTSSDDKLCTRCNLYNAWVSALPDDARNVKGDLSNASAVLLDQKTLGNVKTISVTFDFVKGPDSPDVAPGEGGGTSSSDSVAWIMFNSNDYGVSYSVGDVYDPDSTTGGLVAKDAAITGQGTYTVSLDFTGVSGGYANSIAFSALGIKDGESLFPGYIIDIKEIDINGEKYNMVGNQYTASDDGNCTRCNLYNQWVSTIPDDARNVSGDVSNVSAVLIDPKEVSKITSISVTFDYVPGADGVSANDANAK